jgi:thiol-disulfide isomerase/thioredoxin
MSDSVQTDGAAEAKPAPTQNATLTALGLILIAGAVLCFLVMRERDDASPDKALAHPAVGAPLVNFDVAVLTGDGENVLAGDLKGKVALISIWGSSCGPCLKELPHLAKLAENLRDRDDFRWLPVAYLQTLENSPSQLRQDVSAVLARNGLNDVTYYDPNNSLLGAASAAGAFQNSFPCVVLVNRAGNVHAVWNRGDVANQIEAAVMGLLDEPAQ